MPWHRLLKLHQLHFQCSFHLLRFSRPVVFCRTTRPHLELPRLESQLAAIPIAKPPISHVRAVGMMLRGAGKAVVVRRRAHCRCATTTPVVTAEPSTNSAGPRLLYDGICLDMDGTMTQAHIDFADMRARTGIPVGDLFTVMESWEEPERIRASMEVILEIEAGAAARVSTKEGLLQLLQLLRDSDVRVALITRNTTASVDAFFELIGQQWRGAFDRVLTREWRYVKPDKRLLIDLAQEWDTSPGRLLMVGDSLEDVEVGNAAGSASCLIAGGGNEKPGAAAAAPPPGAVPTLAVNTLSELAELLAATRVGGGGGAAAAAGGPLRLGWAATGDGLPPGDPSLPNAPAPGLDFVWWLAETGALALGSCSFPRMGAAAGGLATCPNGGGDAVLHLGCGDGSLTKMVASKGLRVVGVDADVAAARRRGLVAEAYAGGAEPLAAGSLAEAAARGPFDVVVAYACLGGEDGGGEGAPAAPLTLERCLSREALAEMASVAAPGARLCLSTCALPSAAAGVEDALEGVLRQLAGSAWKLQRVVPASQEDGAVRVNLVAVLDR